MYNVIFQAIHNREIDEKDRKMKFRLEQQKTDLNSQVSLTMFISYCNKEREYDLF